MLRSSVRSVNSSGRLLMQSSKRHSSDHHEPLAPAQHIAQSYLVTPVALTIGVVALYQLNESYKKRHDGNSLISMFGKDYDLNTLKEVFKGYQATVSDERKLYELIGFTPKYDKHHYPLHIDDVPGRYFPFNPSSNYAVSVDFENLEERRKRIDYYKW